MAFPALAIVAVAAAYAMAGRKKPRTDVDAAADDAAVKVKLVKPADVADVKADLGEDAGEFTDEEINAAVAENGTDNAKAALKEVAKRRKRRRRGKRKPTRKKMKAATPAAAAKALRQYLRGGGNFGTKANPSRKVSRYQRRMGMAEKERDGIVGPKTRRRAKKYGVVLPLRGAAATSEKARNQNQATIEFSNAMSRQSGTESTAAQIKAQEDTHDKKQRRKRKKTPKAAALALRTYLKKRGANFGSKRKRSRKVRRLQKRMKRIKADGIVGPKTRKRAAALGVKLPRRRKQGAVVAPKPAPQPKPEPQDMPDQGDVMRTPMEAAEDLRSYLQEPGANFGTRSFPSAVVQDAQYDMGDPNPDGIMGPNTRQYARDQGVILPLRS